MTDLPTPIKAVMSVAQALAKVLFGDKVHSIVFMPRGVMNHKFKVALRDGDIYVFRFYPAGREHVVEYEPDLLRRCVAAGLPVPKVVVDSRSGPKVGQEYTVYRWLHGQPLDERLPFFDRSQLDLIANDVLAFLERFKELTVSGFGGLVSAKHAEYSDRKEFLTTTLENFLAAPCSSSWNEEMVWMLRRFVEGAASNAVEAKVVMTWGDISTENIILDAQDRLAGLLDFEGAMAADFSLTIGYCQARYFNTPFFDALMRQWPRGREGNFDFEIQLYSVLRGLRLLRFAANPLPTGGARMPIEMILPGFQHTLKQLQQPQTEGQ